MLKASAMLDEVKEAIMNAYQLRTGMSRTKLSNLMDAESFFPVHKAMELGFADGMIMDDKRTYPATDAGAENYIFSRRTVNNSLMDKVLASVRVQQNVNMPVAPAPQIPHIPQGVSAVSLEKRLNLIPHYGG